MTKEHPMFHYDSDINQFLELAYSFQKSRVFLTAYELEIFSILGDEYKLSEEVAAEIPADKNAVERLMNALVAIGILTKKAGKFSNTKISNLYLVNTNPNYIGNLRHLNQLWNTWGNLTESVKTGTAVNLVPPDMKTPEQIEDFISAMHWRANLQAPDLIKMLNLSSTTKVLDIGGGSGAYSVEMVKASPHIEAYVLDLPEVIGITEKFIEMKGFKGKVKTIAANFKTDKLGKGYDLIFISHILHSNSFYENFDLLRKVYDALKPGGQIVLQEFLIDDDKTSPMFPTLFSLNMLVNTRAGDVLTETDIWMMLKECWFSGIERKDTPFGTSLVMAKK